MNPIVLNDPSTSAADNVARIKTAIEQANKHYLDTGEKVTVQLGAGTWIVTGDKTNPSVGAIELLSGVELTGTLNSDGLRATTVQLEDNFNARLNGIVRTALETVENVTISNLIIDGNRGNNIGHQAGFICGVKAESGQTQSNIVLDNVEAMNCTAYGINPHEITSDLTIKNSESHNNGLDGFVADGVIRGTYENNVAYNNDRHGFNIQNASTDITLENNIAYDNGSGATGGAGIVVQRGDIQRDDEPEIAHVTNVRIIGGEYYGNTREGILVKLSDNVTISGANIHDNMRQGVRIEGSVNTVLKESFISSNSQETAGAYDEVRILQRADYPDGDTTESPAQFPLKNYYSTGTQILDNVINPEDARNAIREEPTNTAGGPTGSVISGNVTGGIATVGDDTLVGSGGVDTMAGGAGNDTYIVNKDGDIVIENTGEGTDHVFASAKHTLGANVENLTIAGTVAKNGYGNELDNILTGNSAANVLEGRAGADIIYGGGGDDNLKGEVGNDYLDGGVGADTMVGGVGNDTYVVDNVGDVVTEKADSGQGGYDRVFSSVSFTLSDEVEELNLTGTANLNATGNSAANVLNGNAGDNALDGRGGADSMNGGAGNDTYYVDHSGDVVNEAAGAGIDTIISSISIKADTPLTANVENLQLIDPVGPTAKPATQAAGNQLNNRIIANNQGNDLFGFGGNDTLIGGRGNDVIDGGADTDTVVYAGKRSDYVVDDSTALRKVTGADIGTDTLKNVEVIQFSDGRLNNGVWEANPSNPGTPSTPGTPSNPGTPSGPGTSSIPVETRIGTSKANTLTGNDNINIMKGQGGNDVIKGRGADDKLYGGTGNDKVYGDSGDDSVYGDSGNDLVYGGIGNDRVYGGAGNDKVYGDAGNDHVYGGGGHDTVVGGSGDDVIDGDSGNDILYGNAGSDAFVFSDKLGTAKTDRKVNFDTIKDFSVAADSLWLDNAIFRKLGSGTSSDPGQLNKEFFVTGTKAREKDDYLIYNKKTGVLSYDADGSGSKEAVEFAQLSKNLKLTYKDFFVI
jgi:parallel beta-helix repeat protein